MTMRVDYATSGASLLGVESTTTTDVPNISGLGGAFNPTAGGKYNTGIPNAGAGAFYNVSRVIDGVTFGAADVGKVTILVKDEVDHPERNGIYVITAINDDLTMNLARVDATNNSAATTGAGQAFNSSSNMVYGTQVTVVNGTSANKTFFMASPSVTNVSNSNATGTGDAVVWVLDQQNPDITLMVDNAALTTITQNIDLNFAANNMGGLTTITSANAVEFSGAMTVQNRLDGVSELAELQIVSGTTPDTGTGMLFSGVISEANSNIGEDYLFIGKSGTGVTTFTGSNTYHGDTSVYEGTLLVNNTAGSGTGYGNVVVYAGATLGGTGTIAPGSDTGVSNGLWVQADATLMVGTANSTTASQLHVNLDSTGSFAADFTGGLLTPGDQAFAALDAGSILKLNLFLNEGANTTAEADRLVFNDVGAAASQITIDGAILQVGIGLGSTLDSSTFQVGDSWKLIDWGGLTPTGTFYNIYGSTLTGTDFDDLPTLTGGRFWDISNLYSTGVIVVAVPEPARLILLLFGILALGWRRRRRQAV